MGMLSVCAKILLVIINLILGIMWMAIAIVGGLLAWGTPLVTSVMTSFLGPLTESLKGVLGGQEINIDGIITIVLDLGKTLGIVLFVIGLILFVVCFCGCFGACCNSAILLKIFGGLLSLMILGQIVFVIIYFAKPAVFFKPAEEALTATAVNYEGLKGTNSDSVLWNLIQTSLTCCGSTSAHDFDNPPSKWSHKEIIEDPTSGAELEIVLAYPITCCKMNEQFKRLDATCGATFDDTNSNINTPCFTKMQDHLKAYSNIVLYVFIGILVGQAIMVAMAFALACSMNKNKDY